ncbi:MAG: hypothetical protein HZC28_04670 [Spirochaetes bacterium]|nr:hypothetical protein [Spirochaetota bacterium]
MRIVPLLLALMSIAVHAAEYRLIPVSMTDFWITPDTPSVLSFRISNGGGADAIPCVIRNYSGDETARINAVIDGDIARVAITVPKGYYEIAIPGSGQTFGIGSVATFAGPRDTFFGMDCGLTWQTQKNISRDAVMAILKRIGIARVRERFGIRDVAPLRDVFKPEGTAETIRKAYGHNGIRTVEMFHGGVSWMESKGDRDIPGDVIVMADVWRALGARWADTTAMLEVWNEVDAASYSGNKPVDQYVSLVKAIRYLFQREQSSIPVSTCGFTGESLKRDDERALTANDFVSGTEISRTDHPFLDLAGENGLMENVDVFSFHFHSKVMDDYTAQGYIDIISAYRSWTAKYSRPSIPLVNTESGVNFTVPKGASRPEPEVDDRTAAGHVFKIVESKACGLSGYYAFYLQHVLEDVRCWGLLDSAGTPFRPFVAYANAIAMLANAEYAGELADSGLGWTRVFFKANASVIVVYRPSGAGVTVTLPFTVHGITGIDGSDRAAGGSEISLNAGITYLHVDTADVKKHITTNTASYRLYQMSRGADRPVPKLSPIVLQRRIVAGREIFSTPKNYIVSEDECADMLLEVRVNNLSGDPQNVSLSGYVKSNMANDVFQTGSIDVPPMSYRDVQWRVNAARYLTGNEPRIFYVDAKCPGTPDAVLAVKLQRETTFADMMKTYPNTERLPVGESSRWSTDKRYFNWAGGAVIDLVCGQGVRFSIDFRKDGHKWIFPFFILKDKSFSGIRGLIIRGRAEQPATVMINFLSDYGKTLGHKEPIFPADNKWHTVFVALDDIKDIDSVRLMEIGGLSMSLTNTYHISDMMLVLR